MNTHHQLLSSALHRITAAHLDASGVKVRHSGGHCAVLAVYFRRQCLILSGTGASRGFCFAARCSVRCGARQVGEMRASELDTLPPCGPRPASVTPRADAGSHRHTAAGRAGTRRGTFPASPRRGRTHVRGGMGRDCTGIHKKRPKQRV